MPLFQRAWAEVVSRHPILRTAFMWDGLRRPLQRVDAAVTVPWVVEDWRGMVGGRAGGGAGALPGRGSGARVRPRGGAVAARGALPGGRGRALVRLEPASLAERWLDVRARHQRGVPTVWGVAHRGDRRADAAAAVSRLHRVAERQDPVVAERYWRQVLGGLSRGDAAGRRSAGGARGGPALMRNGAAGWRSSRRAAWRRWRGGRS